MKFETSKKIDNWVKKHQEICVSHATAGEQFIFRFLPSGIIDVQEVKCMICGESITDYVE